MQPKTGAPTSIDPVLFEVIRNGLVEATEEMGVALKRSAYSTNIKTRSDFSCVFFDAQLRPVAQGFAQPAHLGSMVEIVPRAVTRFGPERLRAGDALISNHPYIGGVHLNDISVISPVFWEDELFGYAANIAHHVDVGGGAPASIGPFREIFQEGVIIPPVRVVSQGQVVEDIFEMILAQIRSKHETAGDFRAQLASNHTGVRRVLGMVERYGIRTMRDYIDELIAYADRRTRAELAGLPHGTFEADGYLDTDGFTDKRVHLVVKVIIGDDGIEFDLTGSDPQRRAPVNSTFAQTLSACIYAFKCLIDPDIPANAGFYDLIAVTAPAGSVVNCTTPAPVVGGFETHARVTDIVFKALADVLPEVVPAGTKAMQCHAGFGGLDPASGSYYCFLETLGGGYGARATSDGPDAVQMHGQNTENAPIEETERNYPVRILRYELVEDSEGPGRHRGGLGLRRDYEFVDHEATFTVLADRDREGPWGLFGGHAGRPAEYLVGDGSEFRRVSSKSTFDVGPGDIVSYRTCGGGGYGPPTERDPGLVLADVLARKVSVDRARSIYRVSVDVPGRRVDGAETDRLRREANSGHDTSGGTR
jgi:N-methylhydantoinase B